MQRALCLDACLSPGTRKRPVSEPTAKALNVTSASPQSTLVFRRNLRWLLVPDEC
jgi:hypothetical protein